MASRAGSLLRLIPKAPVASPLRNAMPMRAGGGHGHGGPDPNAVCNLTSNTIPNFWTVGDCHISDALQPKWEQAVRRILWNDEHVVFAVLGGWVSILCICLHTSCLVMISEVSSCCQVAVYYGVTYSLKK